MPGERLQRSDFHGDVALDFDMLGFVVTSALLATVALVSDSVPVLIGAMILAPIFDPLIAIPFGIVNRDYPLVKSGLIASLVMFVVAFGVCYLTAWVLFNTEFVPPSLAYTGQGMVGERLIVGWHSVIIAIAAGTAGALASASDRRQNIVGVVVAVALVPSLAAAAIEFNLSGDNAWGGIALFAVNAAGIVVASLVVLLLRKATGKAEETASRIANND